MARKAPILGSISCNGRCMTWTRADRNAKQITIAIRSVMAIFTIVHRRSSRCSRNGFDVSLSGSSRNLKRLRKDMGFVEALNRYIVTRVTKVESPAGDRAIESAKSQAPGSKTQTNPKKQNSKFQERRAGHSLF